MKASNTTRRAAAGAVIVIVLALFAYLAWPPSATTPTPPNPNGYDDFVAAGKILPKMDWDKLNIDELRVALETNKEVFTLVQRGLSKKCQTPINFHFADHIPELMGEKRLAQALVARGNFAQTEGRINDAVNDGATIIALGIESAHGGPLISALVEIAIESMGVKQLAAAIPSLDKEGALQCLQTLQKAVADRDPFAKVMSAERLYYLHEPLREKLSELYERITEPNEAAKIEAKARSMYEAHGLTLLRIEAQLAARAFELEKGRPATNWSDLVPTYLPAIPNDPTTNRPIQFGSW
jgi:hypothetical protein